MITEKPLPEVRTFAEPSSKRAVVLHHTAGPTALGAYLTFAQGGHVNTPYIVDIDGSVWHLYDEAKRWGFHLGLAAGAIKAAGLGYGQLDRETVGIEIASWGALTRKDDKLFVWNGDYYCATAETHRYCRVSAGYRGAWEFARYSSPQIEAVAALCATLCERYGIPRVIPPRARRFDCSIPIYAWWKGVMSHSNLRSDKTDLPPGAGDEVYAALLRAGFTEAQ